MKTQNSALKIILYTRRFIFKAMYGNKNTNTQNIQRNDQINNNYTYIN